MRVRFTAVLPALVLLAATCVVPGARAQIGQNTDPVQLDVVSGGHGKVRLTVTAGASGAPTGFQVCWMTSAQFKEVGETWTWPWVPGEGWVDYNGIGTLNTWGLSQVDFRLGSYESIDIEIGDTRAETGVSGTIGAELAENTEYAFVAIAHGAGMGGPSVPSATVYATTSPQGGNCTYTIGYWKTHPGAWPVSSLKLGTVTYSATQLMSIFNQSVSGNGLISLSHQLIAAKLNIANGADPTSISTTIAAADALVGGLVVPPVGTGYLAPSQTSTLTQGLDDYNNGEIGPGHCGSTPARRSTWGSIKTLAR